MNSDNLPDFNEMTRREIEDYLVERAMVDAQFRKELLSDASSLLRRIGLPVGPEVTIRVLEEVPSSFYIVLPHVLRELDALDDGDLESVSGGHAHTSQAHRFFKGYR